MPRRRAACLTLLACLVLAALAAPARADLSTVWPFSKLMKTDSQLPENFKTLEKKGVATEAKPPLEPPKSSGPLRSCGNGMGLGLAGIGVAWGLMWVGLRVARRKGG